MQTRYIQFEHPPYIAELETIILTDEPLPYKKKPLNKAQEKKRAKAKAARKARKRK